MKRNEECLSSQAKVFLIVYKRAAPVLPVRMLGLQVLGSAHYKCMCCGTMIGSNKNASLDECFE
jgi:hypothetical protein